MTANDEVIRVIDPAMVDDLNAGFLFDWNSIARVAPKGILLGYYQLGELVGLVMFERRGKGFLCNEVIDLEVKRHAQGHHVGAKLLAQVMFDSFEQRFDGYVHLKTKTNGVEKFYIHLGGEYRYRSVLFDTNASMTVVRKYLPKGGMLR